LKRIDFAHYTSINTTQIVNPAPTHG
jgi:hypothetical protein